MIVLSPLFLLLPILLPVIGGFLILPLHFQEDRKRNLYAETIVILTSVLVWIAIFAVRREPVELYSFTRGFSIDLRVDGPAMLFAGMVSLMWPFVMLYAFDYMAETHRKNMFFAFYVMTYGITLGVAFASNMTTLYVFYEMLSLVTIPLVIYYQDHESLYAGRKYAAYTIGGASLAFFAVLMTTVYGDAGNFAYGGSILGVGAGYGIMQVAYLFAFFGFGVKAAVFPLHDWLPTASAAPTPVTALLHAVAVVNSGVFAIMRTTWYVYGPEYLMGRPAQIIAILVAAFTLVFAAGMALKERHFKRRLAYSTVSNLSYMLFGIMLLTPEGLTGGLLHMLFHGIIKMSLFLCAGAFMHVMGKNYIYEVNGVGRKMPITFTVYTLGALSLTGIPLFCGFVSKWHLITAGIAAGTAWGLIGVIALILSAFLCAMYTLNVSIRAFFPPADKDRFTDGKGLHEAHLLMLIPMLVFAVINVIFGMFPGPIVSFIERIAAGLI